MNFRLAAALSLLLTASTLSACEILRDMGPPGQTPNEIEQRQRDQEREEILKRLRGLEENRGGGGRD